ncbi:MAG: hypothetical protein NE328_13080 [Lentisphaeraceae bacterium]|nr:hypothetical protein [Lentisphaeraceae bacterium]
MTIFKSIIAACVMAVLFVSCGADSKEKIIADAEVGMEEMVNLLEGIKDKATAEAAKPKLEALAERMNKLKDRADALKIPKADLDKEMQASEKIKGLMGKLMGSMMRIGMNKEISGVLEDTMKKMQ